jgi:hypothetical protein
MRDKSLIQNCYVEQDNINIYWRQMHITKPPSAITVTSPEEKTMSSMPVSLNFCPFHLKYLCVMQSAQLFSKY